MVSHIWPYGALIVLKCYRHWSLIVLIYIDGTTNILRSREGLTQGGSLAMVVYVIVILLLIKCLKAAYLDITQP